MRWALAGPQSADLIWNKEFMWSKTSLRGSRPPENDTWMSWLEPLVMTQCYGHISSRGYLSRDRKSLDLVGAPDEDGRISGLATRNLDKAPLPPPHSTQSKMYQLFATIPSPSPGPTGSSTRQSMGIAACTVQLAIHVPCWLITRMLNIMHNFGGRGNVWVIYPL